MAHKPGATKTGSLGLITKGLASTSLGGAKSANISLFPPKPKRPNNQVGPGNKVDLITNLFRISLNNKELIYRFDVEINVVKEDDQQQPGSGADKLPRKLSREIRKLVLEAGIREWSRTNPQKKKLTYVYDNNASALYALFNLFPKSKEKSSLELTVPIKLDTIVDLKVTQREQMFKVKFFQSKTTILDIDKLFEYCKGIGSDITRVQECIRAMNVILHGDIINIDQYVVTPMSVFDIQGRKTTIGPKVLLREGFSMSTRPTATGLLLNVSNSFNAFHEETDLISLLRDRFFIRDLRKPLDPRKIDDLKREMKNKQVEARHINYGTRERPHYRKYRVNNIEGNCLQKFTLLNKVSKTTEEITIQDYFKREHNVTIQYPHLPCIIDKGRKIPLEVCHLIDKQRVTRKLTAVETANTIKVAAVKPELNFQRIKENVKLIDRLSQPKLNQFGLKFDMKPIEVTGRELMPTFLTGQSKNAIRASDGQYNAQRERFLKPARIGNWALVALLDFETEKFKSKYPDLGHQIFANLYSRAASIKGMQVGRPLDAREIPIPKNPNDIKQILKEEFNLYNKKNVDHVIFLLSDCCPDYLYRYLQYLETLKQPSRASDQKFTRVTCLKLSNFENKIVRVPDRSQMFVSNLLLKYNTKMGGINFALNGDPKVCRFLEPGYIFISLDVCHPAPGDKLAQSVAAAVGMWDLNNHERSYRTCIRVQQKVRQNNSTVEDVGEVNLMFEDILRAYFLKKRTLPNNVVILRDGVSEGQLKIVLEGELAKVYAMMDRVYKINKLNLPKVTCMVVQKRHKVRFMRKQPVQSRNGPDFNIQPGTVVDSEITHPTDFTFYLAPHKAIQGTSRAAHIYVIHDQIGFSQDEAQSMVHALSYLSPRCTKSTSIPTPVNLADRAAERGKNLVICWQEENMHAVKKGKGGDGVGFGDEQLKALNEYLQNIGDANYRNTLFYI